MQKEKTKKDILDRTFKFSVNVLKLTNKLPRNPAGFSLANQLVRSGTSIGANIQEAQSAPSKRDFAHKLNISLKEARETAYWLDLILESGMISEKSLGSLRGECEELIKILVISLKSLRKNSEL